MRSIYVSGGITGVKDYRTKFAVAESDLVYTGNWDKVVNPVRVGDEIEFPEAITESERYPVYMRADLIKLLESTHVYILDGWSYSVGALIEIVVAKICGHHFIFQNPRYVVPGWTTLLKYLMKAAAKKGIS